MLKEGQAISEFLDMLFEKGCDLGILREGHDMGRLGKGEFDVNRRAAGRALDGALKGDGGVRLAASPIGLPSKDAEGCAVVAGFYPSVIHRDTFLS